MCMSGRGGHRREHPTDNSSLLCRPSTRPPPSRSPDERTRRKAASRSAAVKPSVPSMCSLCALAEAAESSNTAQKHKYSVIGRCDLAEALALASSTSRLFTADALLSCLASALIAP